MVDVSVGSAVVEMVDSFYVGIGIRLSSEVFSILDVPDSRKV